jgi:glycosyltransferase involved in cell wall biosynthesis
MSRKRVLCFTSYYLPGFKSGGPVRSLINFSEWLGDDLDIHIVTRNRDVGSTTPYENRIPGRLYPVHGAQVQYLSAPYWRPGPLRRLVLACQPDLLYFNSILDPALSIAPLVMRRVHWIPRPPPVLVAPRGEFSPGALSIKPVKKSGYLRLARRLGLYNDVTWHATSEPEVAHIQSWWGPTARILLAPNLPPRVAVNEAFERPRKMPGQLRLAFLSRISVKKNLHGALAILQGVKAPIQFDIFGTQEDRKHWETCSRLMSLLPRNITASYQGVVPPEKVISTLSRYDAFFLPTLGENFGHVILEALLAGCPVLLSDQTPWRDLAVSHAGLDLPLDQPDRFREGIEKFAAMDSREFEQWSRGAREFGVRYCSGRDIARTTLSMLEKAMKV